MRRARERFDDAHARKRLGVRPYFEDFEHGQLFADAPALTITSGHAAVHQALTGDRLRLPLDAELSRAVTGAAEALAHPNLVCDIAIGRRPGRPSGCSGTSSTAVSCC